MRRTYIDNIRWITVFIVVIYHVIYMFNGITQHGIIGPFHDFQPQDVFQYIVYPWFMFLLFVVSGMSARFELERKGEKDFIKNRTRKYLVPSTIGLLVFWWLLGYYNMLISGAFEMMGSVPKPVLFVIMCISGTGVLWYIQMLWIFSIFLMMIRKVEKDKLYDLGRRVSIPFLIILVVVVFGSAQILNTPIIVVYRFGIYGLGFFLGYFIFSHDEITDKMEEYWWMFGILAILSGMLFVVMYWGKPYPEHEVLDTFVCNVYAWFGTLGVLAFMKKWGDFENHYTKWLCKKAWGIYIFHYLGIAVSAWHLTQHVPQMPVAFIYLLVTVSGFVGSLILYEVIARIPVMRWCILGIKSRRKKE